MQVGKQLTAAVAPSSTGNNYTIHLTDALRGTSGNPLCSIELDLYRSFAVPRIDKPPAIGTVVPPSPLSSLSSPLSSGQAVFKGFPVVILYNTESIIKNGSSQDIFLSNFRDNTEVMVKLLPAFDRRNLFAPMLRDGWIVANVSSFDGSVEHMVVPWEVSPTQPQGKYFLAAYQSDAPAWFAYSPPFYVDGPTDSLDGQTDPKPLGVTSLSASQILDRLWREPQARRRRRRGRRAQGVSETITVFTASGTDSALTKAFQKAKAVPEELWFSFLDMPSTLVAFGNATIVRELLLRVPLLEDYPAVKQLNLSTRDDQSPTEVREGGCLSVCISGKNCIS